MEGVDEIVQWPLDLPLALTPVALGLFVLWKIAEIYEGGSD
jgi:hypothetical protein